MDFSKDNREQLHKMLKNNFPDHVVMNEWKNDIFEKMAENLHREGFTDEQIRKVARAVWVAFDI